MSKLWHVSFLALATVVGHELSHFLHDLTATLLVEAFAHGLLRFALAE